jgi:hypothetical protein
MNAILPPESDELMHAIREALSAHPTADGLHLSIEPHARALKGPDGAEGYVKALCWNLVAGGQDLSQGDPDLFVVDEAVNEDTLRADVERLFPGIGCEIDNDILIEEDD